jgi:hypothetical protein
MAEWTRENITKHRLKGEEAVYGEGTGLLIHNIKEQISKQCAPFERGDDPLNAESVTKAIHTALRDACPYFGHNPDCETFMRSQDMGQRGQQHHVSWEAGPYDWAIPASFAVMTASGRLCEPYYGFDLQLYDWE